MSWCDCSWSTLFWTAVAVYAVWHWLNRPKKVDTPAAQRKKRTEQTNRFIAAGIDPSDASIAAPASDADLAILNLTAGELSASIRAGTINCHDSTLAYCRQSVRAQRAYNSLTEVTMREAIAHAKTVESTATGTTADQPLYGVPISLKDSVGITGCDNTLGLANSIDQPAAADSVLVTALRAAGAIPIIKTNVPQTMLSFECSNPLFGRTLNPYNPAFTPGGSSGGEAVSIVTRSSCVGIGTDIGGSVRIPAHFSGCVALKPTGRRTSMLGFRPSVPGQEAVVGVPGPMTSCVDDCALLLQAMWTPAVFARDHDLVPLPFDRNVYQQFSGGANAAAGAGADVKSNAIGRPLRIGYYTHDGFVSAAPPCARAVTETVSALRAAGHTLVEWHPPRIVDGVTLFYGLLSADRAGTIKKIVRGEVLEPYVRFFFNNLAVPKLLRKLIARVLLAAGEEHASRLFGAAVGSNVTELWNLHKLRKEYRQSAYDAFQNAKLDAIICPAHALPPIRHGQYTDITFSCSYTLLFNLLDWPAGVVPITHVDPSRDQWVVPKHVSKAPEPVPGAPPAFRRGMLDKKVEKAYDPKLAAGLPIGVQVATPPFQDEKCLAVMKIIENTRAAKRSDFIRSVIPGDAVAPVPGL